MERTLVILYVLFEVAAIGGFMLLYPRIARKGLLFGVYVGEDRAFSTEARAITRAWYRGMIAAIALALAVGAAVASRPELPLAMVAPILLLIAGFAVLYLVAYGRARRLAPPSAPSLPEHAPGSTAAPSLALPWAVLVVGTLAGLCVIANALAHYDAMPDPMPTHFGPSGRPDGWSRKSVGAVMVLPLMTLVLGVTLGGVALLTARAKRSVRLDGGASLSAQNRFRAAMSRFLAILGLLVTAMLASLSVTSAQVAVGERRALPAWVLAIGGAMFLYTMFGSAWLAIRYGQGGARLENGGATGPLTNGLADNRVWKLGAFYVNREDPSWLVEHRFGFGYTLNFGNPRAVATFCVFLATILGLAVWAIASSS
jgi:uncharacterized membrane protein